MNSHQQTKDKPSVAFIGPFPPPLHGLSFVTRTAEQLARERGVRTVVFDLSGRTLSRSLTDRCLRILRALKVMGRFLPFAFSADATGCYIGVSGGLGQLLESSFVSIARARGLSLVLHHHSFRYLHARNLASRMLFGLAGSSATHIVLCDRMAQLLSTQYKIRREQIQCISNAAWMERPVAQPKVRSSIRTLGFLSNISTDKGILEFLEVAALYQQVDSNVRALIAGPYQDKAVEIAVSSKLKKMPFITYLGFVEGSRKAQFFEAIDVLLFPTSYRNEAEPLTILEALSHGVPVVANGLGCIPHLVNDSCGLSVDPSGDFVHSALHLLSKWKATPTELHRASQAALCASHSFQAEAAEAIDCLVHRLQNI